MIRHLARLAATLTLVFSVAACGDDSDPGAPSSITGTYSLRRIDNEPVPVTLVDIPGYKLEMLSGSLAINSGNSFTGATTSRETIDGEVQAPETFTCTGSYTRSGNTLTFSEPETGQDCEGGSYTGTISGTTITIAFEEGFTATFTK